MAVVVVVIAGCGGEFAVVGTRLRCCDRELPGRVVGVGEREWWRRLRRNITGAICLPRVAKAHQWTQLVGQLRDGQGSDARVTLA